MATTVKKGKGEHYPGSKPVKEKKYYGSTALYGRSGTGKTTLSATWPKPMLYLNIRDNGTDSINDLEDVDVRDINTSDELRDVILWILAQANKGKLRYKTIVVDTMSQLQNILVEEKAKEKGRKEIKGSKGKRPGDFGTLTKQQWGEIAGDLKAAVQDIRGLPLESVFIAQERVFNMGEEEDEADMLQPEVGPRLMPSVKDDLNASVSIIGNTYIRVRRKKKRVGGKISYKVKKEYCLRVAPHEVYTTKIRKPRGIEITEDITDPSFAKLQKLVKGTK
jgi:KaiC/GvpD/RAD55 family RecA-like ATPase